jgi:hypothetical protein
MSRPFVPADGVEARWRKLYSLVLSKRENDGISYYEAQQLLGCDRKTAQAAMLETKRRLEEDHKQSVRTQIGFGWIVMRAVEHVDQSSDYMRRAHNQATQSLRVVSAIDDRRGELEQADRHRADYQRTSAAFVADVTSRRGAKKFFEELGTGLPKNPPPLP